MECNILYEIIYTDGLYFQDQTCSTSFSIFLLAHYKMGKLPESLIIKTFIVLRGSPEVPLK